MNQKLRKSDQPAVKIRNGVLISVISGITLLVIGGLAKFTYEANTVYAQKVELKEVEEKSAKKEDVTRILAAVENLVQEQKTLTESVHKSIKQSEVNTTKIDNVEKTLDRHVADDNRWQDGIEQDIDRVRDQIK